MRFIGVIRHGTTRYLRLSEEKPDEVVHVQGAFGAAEDFDWFGHDEPKKIARK